MAKRKPAEDLQAVVTADGRYDIDAFRFVADALLRAAELTGKRDKSGSARHLTAPELVDGAIDLAAERWSVLGDLVLAELGIRSASDIGAITFVLIEHGIFSKEANDRLEDFDDSSDLRPILVHRVRQRALQ